MGKTGQRVRKEIESIVISTLDELFNELSPQMQSFSLGELTLEELTVQFSRLSPDELRQLRTDFERLLEERMPIRGQFYTPRESQRLLAKLNQPSGQDAQAMRERENRLYLGVIISDYIRLLIFLAYRVTGDSESAEDLVQDTCEQAWRQMRTFTWVQLGSLDLKAWLCTITKHIALNHRKRERRLVPLDPLSTWLIQQPGYRLEQPEAALIHRYSTSLLTLALERLPPKQAAIIWWHYVDELTFCEIAKKLNCPLSTIKVSCRRGLATMRRLLLHKGMSPEDLLNVTENRAALPAYYQITEV